MRARNIKVIISLGLVIGAIVLLLVTTTTQTGYTTHYYHTPSEFLETAQDYVGRDVRVNGKVLPGSIRREEVSATNHLPRLDFILADSANAQLPVRYVGTTIPDAFKAEADVVVEGPYNSDGVLEAKQLLVKCPSKYETTPTEDGHPEELSGI
jgi:cytochrome c-type biogenesis protein CcmE